MENIHTFHIPVMGTGFTIDTPVKVAKYGISSVISLVDDTLIEEMRQHYCAFYQRPYTAITKEDEDYRAKRITAYLDLVDEIVNKEFAAVQAAPFTPQSESTKYFELLPDNSALKASYQKMLSEPDAGQQQKLQDALRARMRPGSIDVNIMTKLDRTNYASDKTELPPEYSDALAALRGYAKSRLTSSVVFSAGINRKLYTYIEKFKDFYADTTGKIKKKIILKVSDYRSSIIQGRFLAKKGIWVSEYRVESGLNCGGHAFASNGFLMGPILEEFKNKRNELIAGLHSIYNEALKEKNQQTFDQPHEVKITAQGGIGTAKENNFLISFYKIDGTGWGTPFLLCPEATNVDAQTLKKLSLATENDIELSGVSPLGVPFHNLKESASEIEKQRRIDADRPGSPCPKGHIATNTEFTERPICTASRQYQKFKIDQLKALKLIPVLFKERFLEIVRKACICHELGDSSRINYKISKNGNIPQRFPAVCPGPNIAYFSKITSFAEMVGHIYGRTNILNDTHRPNMFIKELQLYVDYFMNEVKKCAPKATEKQIEYLNEFKNNIVDGINYYKELFPKMVEETQEYRQTALNELQFFKAKLDAFIDAHLNVLSPQLL